MGSHDQFSLFFKFKFSCTVCKQLIASNTLDIELCIQYETPLLLLCSECPVGQLKTA